MSDEMGGAVTATSAEGSVHGWARPLALGLGLLLGGVVVVVFGVGVSPLLAIPGIVAVTLGVVVFVLGVYRFADNADRATKALITGRR
jgi:predicted membrane channel-forming protein YqfA (hemolysin III family)